MRKCSEMRRGEEERTEGRGVGWAETWAREGNHAPHLIGGRGTTLPEVVFSARAGRSLPLQLMKTHRRTAQGLSVSLFLHAGTVTDRYSVRTSSQRR